ncbi:MAG: hypothetical protein QOI56_895 [Actinomycetota bacterium]|nr:hypothetical protein [Actinomycetota bacterium]
MTYVLLIYQGTTPLPGSDAWDALADDEQKRIYADYGKLNHAPGVTPGLPLGLPHRATTVRVADGNAVVSEGPYAGMDEAVAGYFLLDSDDLDAAIELAAGVPAARLGGAVEVRPVEKYW